MSKTLCSW